MSQLASDQHESGLALREDIPQIQRERLAYIDFRLYFLGEIGRHDLMERFGIASAAATRDFSLYKELLPANAEFDRRSKKYIVGEAFSPGFAHQAERVLSALSRGFGDGLAAAGAPLVPCELPAFPNRPALHVLAPLTRAMRQGGVVRVHYCSYSSGATEREIVPLALVNDGLRWHVRVFDRKREKFGDFVLSRMESALIVDGESPRPHERASEDIQWNRIVVLDLVPHPNRPYPEIAERDYGMTDGVLQVKVRAAIAGYVLRNWHVDCSPDHHLEDEAYRLSLRDHLALYGVESAAFAPGYTPPERSQQRQPNTENDEAPAGAAKTD